MLHGDSLNLNAYSERYQELRTFKVDKITAARLNKDHFDYPPGYDPQAMHQRSFGIYEGKGDRDIEVLVEFPESLYDYVANRQWMADQEITLVKSGKFRLKVMVNDLFEIMHWPMGIGSDAKVIKPKALKTRLKQEVLKVLAQY